jgi:hypothetical protein
MNVSALKYERLKSGCKDERERVQRLDIRVIVVMVDLFALRFAMRIGKPIEMGVKKS